MIIRRSRAERTELTVGSNPMEGKTIIGIDPGTNILGYGIIRIREGEAECVVLGVVKLGKYRNRYQKLKHIFERVSALVKEYKPDEMALEAPFYGENVQSMLKLGRAQGVAMAAALTQDIPVFEYAPRRIKQSITGEGAASKEQVAALLQKILEVDTTGKEMDATDGLAVALCHYYVRSSPLGMTDDDEEKTNPVVPSGNGGKGASWASYIHKNPNKIQE